MYEVLLVVQTRSPPLREPPILAFASGRRTTISSLHDHHVLK